MERDILLSQSVPFYFTYPYGGEMPSPIADNDFREEYLREEIKIAQEISGLDVPNMIVYGGGENIRQICLQAKVLYVEQFMTNRRKGVFGNG